MRARSGVPGVPIKGGTGAALVDQPHPAQDEGTHHDLADFGRADHQGAHMHIVKRNRRRALSPGPADGERLAPSELAQFAGKLSGVMGGDVAFRGRGRRVQSHRWSPRARARTARSVPRHRTRSRPGRSRGAAAGKAFRRLDLGLIQNREDLFAAGLGYAHDNSPCLPALLLARRRGKRGMEVAVEGRTAGAERLRRTASSERASKPCHVIKPGSSRRSQGGSSPVSGCTWASMRTPFLSVISTS